MTKDTVPTTSSTDMEEFVDSEMVDSASQVDGRALSAESINLNSDKTGPGGFTIPKDPRTISPRKSSLKSFRENLTKNQETRSAGNLLTSSLIEDSRTTVKRLRTNSGASGNNTDNETSLSNWENLDKLKFIKKKEITCGCNHKHCILCIDTPPDRTYGNIYCDCESYSCLWKNPGLPGKKFNQLISTFGKMSFFPKQTTKSSKTQSESHITSTPSFNSTEEIEDW